MDFEIFGLSGIKLYISKEHRFGTDSLILADYAKSSKQAANKTICDLCSGCGVIPVVLADKKPRKIYAVEIDAEAVSLLKRTVGENNLGFIEVMGGDLRDSGLLSEIGRESADLVTANPPYYPDGSGYERNRQKSARYEKECELTDVIGAAAYLLKYGGELKMCMTAARFADCVCLMRERGIEPKEAVFIMKKENARLFLISGKKGAKPGMRISMRENQK